MPKLMKSLRRKLTTLKNILLAILSVPLIGVGMYFMSLIAALFFAIVVGVIAFVTLQVLSADITEDDEDLPT